MGRGSRLRDAFATCCGWMAGTGAGSVKWAGGGPLGCLGVRAKSLGSESGSAGSTGESSGSSGLYHLASCSGSGLGQRRFCRVGGRCRFCFGGVGGKALSNTFVQRPRRADEAWAGALLLEGLEDRGPHPPGLHPPGFSHVDRHSKLCVCMGLYVSTDRIVFFATKIH